MAGQFWALIQHHIDSQRYRPSERQIAKALGVSPQATSKWKALVGLPAKDTLVAVSRLTGVPYRDVLEAALVDIGYATVEESERDVNASPMTQAAWDEAAKQLMSDPVRPLSEREVVATIGPRPVSQAGELPGVTPSVTAGRGGRSRRRLTG